MMRVKATPWRPAFAGVQALLRYEWGAVAPRLCCSPWPLYFFLLKVFLKIKN